MAFCWYLKLLLILTMGNKPTRVRIKLNGVQVNFTVANILIIRIFQFAFSDQHCVIIPELKFSSLHVHSHFTTPKKIWKLRRCELSDFP